MLPWLIISFLVGFIACYLLLALWLRPLKGWCLCNPFSKNCSRPLPTREQELRNHKLRSGRTLGRGPDLGEPRRKRWGKKQSDARRRARAKGI
jgi:hypothetical protein